jgi:NAD(P)-dependent dehydrogenase (short-subunit alcohol dehydrogenase family)
MSEIRFDDRVAIVTGAGNGLGRSHALELAKRGAKVVVNDLGGARDGTGSSLSAAEEVVKEIEAAGGEAMANGANVTDMAQVEEMVQAAMDKWGRIDILVNNAGILRDKTFAKMEMDDYKLVVDVHLIGTVNCTKACWQIMRDQQYGRIMVTSSPSGLYGIFGQANYSAAKMGLVGFMSVLNLEGAKYGIKANALAPTALTRMTEDLGFPEEAMKMMTPEAVTAGVIYLVSDDAPAKCILSCAGGGFARAYVAETNGIFLPPGEQTPENVAANFDKISDTTDINYYADSNGPNVNFMTKAAEALKNA